MRKVKWLNFDKLIDAINITGTTSLIISKLDILEKTSKYKLSYEDKIIEFSSIDEMTLFINYHVKKECQYVKKILYSDNPETVPSLI